MAPAHPGELRLVPADKPLRVLAGAALADSGRLWQPVALVALGGWVLGCALFSGDIALRAFAGHRLFPMAAPAGGTILILSWLALGVAALGGRQ